MVIITTMALSFGMKNLTTNWCLSDHWNEFVDENEETKHAG